jgi:protein-disulfide isomerase
MELARRRRRYVAALAASVALATGLIMASQLGASDRPATAAAGRATGLFDGLRQQGTTLGSPKAPVTLVEYADLQCPYCAAWTRGALPELVARYVRTGKLRIVFRGLAFLGPDSRSALTLALSAAPQHRFWNVIETLYQRQGVENTGWLTNSLVEGVARDTGLDLRRAQQDARSPVVLATMTAAVREAGTAGIQGTPSFQVGPTDGALQVVHVGSLDAGAIEPAIEAALGR